MTDLATFLTYSGISTILFLLFLLKKNWHTRVANKILADILISFLILFLTYASLYLERKLISAIVSPIGIIIPFAMGPLIFQYIKTIYLSKTNPKELLHSLAPFGVSIIGFSIPHYVLGISFNDKTTFFKILSILIPFLGLMHFAYYLFLSSKLLKRFKRKVKNNYSNLSTLDLKWLSIWIRGFVLFLLVDMVSGLLLLAYPIHHVIMYSNLFYLVLLIWYIGYYGINQTQVFLIQEQNKKEPTQEEKDKPTNFFNCNSEEFTFLKIRLERLFNDEELFKRQSLSLKETADILGITDKKLSHLLNVCLDTNFYEYVNAFRVAYFKNRLTKGEAERLTLLAIAFDSGFNSKATFNRVFKQQEGITPIKFKKQLIK